MAHVTQVVKADNFKTWRERTNEIIDLINIELNGSPSLVTTLKEAFNYLESAGVFSGCAITDNANGTIDVGVGEALIRAADAVGSPIYSATIPAATAVTLVDNDINYVYADWNSGTPVIATSTSIGSINERDKCLVAIISREGNELVILEAQEQNTDGTKRIREMLLETENFKHVLGGSVIGDAGSLKFNVTAGAFYRALRKYPHPSFDTSGADTFDAFYRDGSGGFTKVAAETSLDELYWDDDTGTLNSLNPNTYVVHWIFLKIGSNVSYIHTVYGQAEHNTVSDARTEVVPANLPSEIEGLGVLIGRVIIEQGATSFEKIETAFTESFAAGSPSDHNNLANLQGGVIGERYHLSNTEHTNVLAHLTDTGNPHSVTYTQVGADAEGSAVAMAIALGG